MAYNVTVLDPSGQFLTVFIAPDRQAIAKPTPVATNHQKEVEWQQHAQATATVERERFLRFRLRESGDDPNRLIQSFLRSPVYSTAYDRGFGTLYTAVYRPGSGEVNYLWPNASWRQSFDEFEEGVRAIYFPT